MRLLLIAVGFFYLLPMATPAVAQEGLFAAPGKPTMQKPKKEIYRKPSKKEKLAKAKKAAAKKAAAATSPTKTPEQTPAVVEPAPATAEIPKTDRPSSAPKMPVGDAPNTEKPVAQATSPATANTPVEAATASAEPTSDAVTSPQEATAPQEVETTTDNSGYAPNRINQGGIGAVGGLGKVGSPHAK